MPFQKGQNINNNHYNWKGGISKVEGYHNQKRKEWRHRKGISKKYKSELGISKTKEYKKQWKELNKDKIKVYNKIRYSIKKMGGELSLKTIQLVYEDNIKKYGTLTCYLCLKPILFGKDNLEHKIPLSRGGTSEYANLAVSCGRCNYKKHDKTEEEYRKEILLWKPM